MGGGFRRPRPAPPAGGKTPNPRSSAARRRQDTKPPFQRRPQAARHQTPVARAASCRLARALGRGRGRGQPKENHGRAPDRGPPPPRRRAAGGAPAGGGRVRRRRGTDAGKAANPTPRRPQPATGPPPPRQSAPAGGLRPPAPRRPATRPDAGRPRAGGPAASHQPTPTAARAHGPGPDKAGPLRWGGGGRAGPVPARPAPDRPHTLAGPARHLRGRAGHRHGGGPGAGRFAPETAGGPRGPGAAAYGAGAIPPGRGAASAAKKCREACPPGWTRLDEKKMRGGRFVPPACRYSGYQISPCSA